MPIVSEGGRRGGGGSSGYGRRGQRSGTAGGGGGSSSSSSAVVPGSDSRAAVLQCEEMEESDGEVQSTLRGAFETMDALQDALPKNRKRASKLYNNGKSSSVTNAAQPTQDIANPGNPSPNKRKGFLPFSFSWNKSWSKGSSSRRDSTATSSSKNCSKTLSPAPPTTSSSQGTSWGGNAHARRWMHRRSSRRGVSASPPSDASLHSQLIAVQIQSVCLEDVAESTASVSPREKRRKSLQ